MVVGLPLEMVHGSLRIAAVYMAGVLAGKSRACGAPSVFGQRSPAAAAARWRYRAARRNSPGPPRITIAAPEPFLGRCFA